MLTYFPWFQEVVNKYMQALHEMGKVDMPISNTSTHYGHVYVSGTWLGVDIRINTEKTGELHYMIKIC
jgi:hypothetical protein